MPKRRGALDVDQVVILTCVVGIISNLVSNNTIALDPPVRSKLFLAQICPEGVGNPVSCVVRWPIVLVDERMTVPPEVLELVAKDASMADSIFVCAEFSLKAYLREILDVLGRRVG